MICKSFKEVCAEDDFRYSGLKYKLLGKKKLAIKSEKSPSPVNLAERCRRTRFFTQLRYMHRPKLMGAICGRAGVRQFGFKAIRHYVASYLADRQKFSITQVSRLLRHQSKATTERYLQVIDPQTAGCHG
jgi:integrase